MSPNMDDMDSNVSSKIINIPIKRNSKDTLAMSKTFLVALCNMQRGSCNL